MSNQHLFCCNGHFSCRIKIPVDLKKHFPSKNPLQSVQPVPDMVTSSLDRLPGDNDQRNAAENCTGGDEQA